MGAWEARCEVLIYHDGRMPPALPWLQPALPLGWAADDATTVGKGAGSVGLDGSGPGWDQGRDEHHGARHRR